MKTRNRTLEFAALVLTVSTVALFLVGLWVPACVVAIAASSVMLASV